MLRLLSLEVYSTIYSIEKLCLEVTFHRILNYSGIILGLLISLPTKMDLKFQEDHMLNSGHTGDLVLSMVS